MEYVSKTKIEVWQILLDRYEEIKQYSIGGAFCIIRKRNYITWGEWHYLHSVLEKNPKAEFKLNFDLKGNVELIIKKLKENESKV